MKLVNAIVIGDTHIVLSEPLPKDAEEITVRIRLTNPTTSSRPLELAKQTG
jgi:hypothetical protein